MYCRYCGKYIVGDSVFCTHCGKSLIEKTFDENAKINICTPSVVRNNFITNHISLLVNVFCYIALGVFLFFNIKMAPFYGWWKFVAYIVEGGIAIGLVVLTRRKIAESSFFLIKILSLIFSILIILSSISLRIIYDSKVDMVEKDIPSSGTILVAVSSDTDYYSYISGVVYDPSTSIKINGASAPSKITLGKSTKLEITVRGNHNKGSTSDIVTLNASSFKNGEYSITKSVYLENGLSSSVKIDLRRYCTFWEVIFY